jgi:putative ABC transport system permease protein
MRYLSSLDNLVRDFRYALRNLRMDRRFTIVAVFALALGIGASTVMFSVVYNVLFDAFPYKDSGKSVVFELRNLANAGGWKGRGGFGPEEFRAFSQGNHVFEDIIGSQNERVFYDDGRETRRLESAASVTANAFEYLGVPALLGRVITPGDGEPGAAPVFVMHYRLWQAEFSGDPAILGRTFILNDKPRTLVGIMPPRFNWYGASVWFPLSSDGGGWISPMGRLKPGVSLKAALADIDAIAHRLQQLNPGSEAYPAKFAIVGSTLLDAVIGEFKSKLYALLAAVLLLLLIACSNVANLLLARATKREKEIAVRASLGASRSRLVRQLLVESFVLAAAAGASGWALSYIGLKVIVGLIPADSIPGETVIGMSSPVLLLALGVTVVATLLCGLAPALHVVRGDLQRSLTGSGKSATDGFRHARLRGGLVVLEVALSIVLLIGAGLLARSFLVLTRVDLGFSPKNVLYARLSLPKSYDNDRAKQNALTRELLERLKSVPGVMAVSESMLLPPLTYDWSDTIIPGKPHAERWETRYEICSDGFFETLGLKLQRGRLFSGEDMDAKRFVMVVNEKFAQQYFANEEAIGQKVKLQVLDRTFLDAPHDTYFEVVGVVSDYKTRSADPPEWQEAPMAFVPYSVQGFSWRTYMVRSAIEPKHLMKELGQEARSIDPAVGILESGTIEQSLKEYYRGPQFEMATLGAFAAVGLALVTIGIFSVMAYTVSLRTREIGVRMVLGAEQGEILRMVLRKGFVLIAAGICIGLFASYGLTRFLASQIWGVSATDPWTFGAVVALMVGVGLAASYFPARRATQVDSLVALRYE